MYTYLFDGGLLWSLETNSQVTDLRGSYSVGISLFSLVELLVILLALTNSSANQRRVERSVKSFAIVYYILHYSIQSRIILLNAFTYNSSRTCSCQQKDHNLRKDPDLSILNSYNIFYTFLSYCLRYQPQFIPILATCNQLYLISFFSSIFDL